MSNNFEENNKFFNTDGTINRRTFITNLLITEIFEALVYSTPMLILLIINPDITSSIMKSAIQTGMFPRWLAIYCFVVWIMKIGLLYPSIVKRIRDITGNYDNTNWVFAVLAFSVMAFLPAPPAIRQILSSVPFVIAICLMVLKGRISGERPKSEIFKFNWGAMFGTWIWGLINKSYITLLSIPLFFTTGFIPFMIICGIKGNEWAYKTDYRKSVYEFKMTQIKWAAAGFLIQIILPAVVLFVVCLFLFNNPVDFAQNAQCKIAYDKLKKNLIKTDVKTTQEGIAKNFAGHFKDAYPSGSDVNFVIKGSGQDVDLFYIRFFKPENDSCRLVKQNCRIESGFALPEEIVVQGGECTFYFDDYKNIVPTEQTKLNIQKGYNIFKYL